MRKLRLGIFLTGLLGAVATPALAQEGQDYEQLIQQARQGRYDSALQGLQLYQARHPQARRPALDLIRVQSWAGQAEAALHQYQSLPLEVRRTVPADVLLLVARAYKDTGQWQLALEHYQQGWARYPDHREFLHGECLTLADLKRYTQALMCADRLQQAAPGRVDHLLARSYIYRSSGQSYDALLASQQAMERAPREAAVLREYDQALHAARLNRLSLEQHDAHPELFEAGEKLDREADYAAELTRLAPQPTRTSAERFVIASRALDLQAEMAASPRFQQDEAFRVRIQGDRLLALDARDSRPDIVPHDEAIAESLYPPYAYGSLGTMQLRARKPEQAVRSYERALEQPDLDEKTRMYYQSGLAFALLESGRQEDAVALAENLEKNTAPVMWFKGNPSQQANPNYTDAFILKNSLYTYTGSEKRAREELAKAVAVAPTNTNLRIPLAEAQQLSGMPRAAERNLKIAESYAPHQEGLIITQAQNALQLQEWRQAEILLRYAEERFPTNTRVAELRKDWERYRKSELQLRAGVDRSHGGNASGQNGVRLEAQLYSSPLGYNWRATALAGHISASEDEDRDVNWQGAGAEWRGRDLRAEAIVHGQSYGHGYKPGASLTLDHDLSDAWTVGGSLHYRSLNTPIRALSQDIQSNEAQLRLGWRQALERRVDVSYTAARFTDGNTRHSLLVNLGQRIHSGPRVQADAQLELWATRNSRDDVPYYSPRQEYLVLPGVRLQHSLYRRYERQLSHYLSLGAGLHHQKDYGSAGVFTAGYGLLYQHDRNLEVGLHLGLVSRPYDGQREQDYSGMLELKFKF